MSLGWVDGGKEILLVVHALLKAGSYVDQHHLEIGRSVTFKMFDDLFQLLLVECISRWGVSNALYDFLLLLGSGEQFPWKKTLSALYARERL